MADNKKMHSVTPAVAHAPALEAKPLPRVPSSWPGAFGLYKYSKQAVKLNLGTLVVLWLISIGVSSTLQLLLKVPGQVLGSLVSVILTTGFTFAYIAGVRGRQVSPSQALDKALSLWLKMIGLNILVALSAGVSLALLIVPFFVVYPRLTLANYFLVDKNLDVIEAYKASWNATKGYSVRIWGIIGAGLLMAMLCLTIIGIPFAIYFLIMYSAASAVTYEFINKAQAAPSNIPAGTAPAK